MAAALLPSWNADEWTAFGTVLLGLGALAAGVWSVFNYYKTRRAEAARWLHTVFTDFYLGDRFRQIKLVLEYEYSARLGPLLERRITDRDVPITTADQELLDQLDMLLNYFEQVLYLEGVGQMRKDDRQAVFEYWFELLEAPDRDALRSGASDRAAVRRYVARYGYERVAKALKSPTQNFIALYGSLRQEGQIDDKPDLKGFLRRKGHAVLRGTLLDLGEYPGLVDGDGDVQAELYEVVDPRAFRIIDSFERYDPMDVDGSLYVRRAVRLIDPDEDAWVYLYNGDTNDAPVIESGDWIGHVAQRADTDVR